ncbi:MAG TPA: hypothetical protein VFV79_00695 [Saprospiraceae bacterium]|nr:hypothetical protein [Saprospiraceae bacterium]
MKTCYFIFLLFIGVVPMLHAQARMTQPLRQRLEGKTAFDEIQREILNYFSEERAKLSPTDSMGHRFLKRQFKFWNRWLYDCESRLEPDGTVANWSKRMYEFQVNNNFYNQSQERASNSGWSLIGPTSTDVEDGIGRVSRMGFHPSNNQIIYAGTAHGGLWRSTTAGASWSAVASYLPSLGISGIEIKQDDPNTIYVLSGDGDAWFPSNGFTSNFGYVSYSNGVFKSTDNGANWSKTAEFEPGINDLQYVGFQMRQDPNNSNTYVVATSEGVFRTTNGGGSWSKPTFKDLNALTISYVNNNICSFDIEYKPGSSTTLYAACRIKILSSGNTRFAFFRSIDNGVIFNEVDLSSDIDVSELIRFEIGVTPDAPNNVYLLCGPGYVEDGDGSNDTFLGFLRSTNSGASFTNIATEPDVFAYNPTVGPTLGNQCFYDMALAISPTNSNYIFTGGLVVFRSTDGGFDFDGNTNYWTWEFGETIHPDIHDLKYNPLDGRLYAASDGGVFYTANNGGAWEPIFNGLSITQFYHAENDNENNKLWGGTQDNGTVEQQSGGFFTEFDGGDGFDGMTDNIVGNGNDSYWSSAVSVVTSGNNGNMDITPPDPNNAGRAFGNLDMHPVNEDYIYVGYADAVWYSAERGDEWQTGSYFNRLDGGTPKGNWSIQACQTNSSRIYAAGGGKMWRIDAIDFTEGGTGTSTSLNTPLFNAGFPSNGTASQIKKVTDILVSPSTSANLWVTAGGFFPGAKVFAGTNSGAQWNNISYNLPNIPANCLLRDSDGTLYVGMDAGIYYLPPGEDAWIPYYNGLPQVPVTEMFFVTEGSVIYIYAATYGRGIWKSQKFTGCASTLTLTSHLEGPRFYQASTSITSSSLIDGYAGTRVHFQAGNNITLTQGFEGKDGIEFTGFILPCNTGPFPDAGGVETDTRMTTSSLPAVIECTRILPTGAQVNIRVREPGHQYGLQLFSASGKFIREVLPYQSYSTGLHRMIIPKVTMPAGLGFLALVHEEAIIDVEEYTGEQ